MAFAIYTDGKIIRYGKIKFNGNNINEKMKDISNKTKAFFDKLPNGTIIVIEDTIYTNSHNTAAQLAKAQGALLGGAFLGGAKESHCVSPIAWQSFIGTRLLTAAEKAAIKKATPNKSAAWYKAKERDIRKHRTIDTMNKTYGTNVDDDDVADAMGIATFAASNWGKVIKEK
jgi:Holliday junction resolvasome RuvABC endonuclease subunit